MILMVVAKLPQKGSRTIHTEGKALPSEIKIKDWF